MYKFPNTIFIFDSILSTGFGWLNRRAMIVNRSLFSLSLELYNTGMFYFLDTHALLRDSRLCVLSPTGNGIHLCYDAGNLVQQCIVDSVIALDRRDSSNLISKVWPLRQEFRQSASAFHDRRRRFM